VDVHPARAATRVRRGRREVDPSVPIDVTHGAGDPAELLPRARAVEGVQHADGFGEGR
jgi:hypothetical protein